MKTLAFAHRRGIALVIVLSLLVLITMLVVGFLVRAGGERTASTSYYVTATTRHLADTAVNLVQAQINEATTGGSGTNAWVSQPGALRVFDNAGQLTKIYRLFSAPSLVSDVADASLLQHDIPSVDWAKNPALWVDLNAPVTISSGTFGNDGYSIFPILDPRDPANPGSLDAPTVSGTLAGFSLSGAVPGATTAQPVPMPVQWLYVLQDGQIVAPSVAGGSSVSISGASAKNPIIGRIAYWTDDECAKVNINTAAGSMSVRPDPSTGNSQTAVLPAPWDTPRFNIWDDTRLFAQNQPVHGEYQRYPGHPATTDMYGILNGLGISLPGYPSAAGSLYSSTTSMPRPTSGTTGLSVLIPRYGEAWSSMGGTAYTTGTAGSNGAATAVVVGTSRLYTSLGEMYFNSGNNSRVANGLTRQQLESGKFFMTAHSRAPEVSLFGTPRISMWPIDSAYGSNPIATNATPLASTFDRMISFCTTTGTGSSRKQYYIQRHDSVSPTSDYTDIQRNRELYSFLKRLAGSQIPGFGGSFAGKYNNIGESDQILTELVDYIRSTNASDHSGTSATGFTPQYTAKFNGYGQVTPIQIGNTQGLGRMFTISEVGLHVICTADGNSPLAYQAPVNVSGTSISPVKGSANDYRYVSNLPVSQLLRDNTGATGSPVGLPDSRPTKSGDLTTGTIPLPANVTLAGTALGSAQKRLQAMLICEIQCPMQGYDSIFPNLLVKVTNLGNVSIGGVNPFPSRCNATLNSTQYRTNNWSGYGGYQQFSILLTRANAAAGSNQRPNGWTWNGVNALNRLPPASALTGSPADAYHFVSDPFTVQDDGTGSAKLNIQGGPFTIELQVPDASGNPVTIQTFNVSFPQTSTPVPDLIQYGVAGTSGSSSAADWWGFDNRIFWATKFPSNTGSPYTQDLGCVFRVDPQNTSPASTNGSWNYYLSSLIPLPFYKNADGSLPASRPSDVVRSLIAPAGDVRLVMGKKTVNANGVADMLPTAGYTDNNVKLAHNFVVDSGWVVAGNDHAGKLVPNVTYSSKFAPKVPSNVIPKSNWDWDTGQIPAIDGAYSNKPDEGNVYTNGGNIPYFQAGNNNEGSGFAASRSSFFTANRIMPSPVMFGSLPTGVKENIPWRTLQFRPSQTPSDSGATYQHDTLGGPPDHLILDWFTMPVVEPYAISEPFSTAGKINMNYQIVPFTYITRNVGLRAVLNSELIARVPKASSTSGYKSGNLSGNQVMGGNVSLARLPLNLDEANGTLRQFQDKFANWGIFKSPSEICDIYLVPKPYTWPGFDLSWYGDDFAMVGDNVRERPYADIYPRLTTKSNTYTVHFRVQALKNPTMNKQDTWNETTGVVSGEYRGSTTIERYLDPGNNDIPDYATNSNAPSLDSYYQWRTISNTAFAP